MRLQVPLLDAQRLTEHFRSIDWEGEGFVTRFLVDHLDGNDDDDIAVAVGNVVEQ